ncbi:DUF4440 domain-containing protein [Streptomyces sp. Ru87]|uniref:nuclear transport factor 2 family protein n=1 Tax=Streptomyces sp. Ru87 TaxID=2044307 RepID=UPI000BF4EF30|nr:nuclear transport factor 2 family protein [Streptomyces sp. Ru87]PGH50549.1 DUF4440 domain-containing protein [Streptomyces sp. Ru87]
MSGAEVQQAVDAERRLLDPGVRASVARVAEALHPEFTEFGASGRRWDRDSVLSLMGPPAPGAPPRAPVTATDFAGTLLAPGLVHLTYASESDGVRAFRSSLWCRAEDGRWLIRFHQATPTTGSPGEL